MIFLSLAATCLLHVLMFRRTAIISPISVFFLAFLYYCYFVPVTMAVFGQYDIMIVQQPLWVTAHDLRLTAIMNFLGYAGYASAYRYLSETAGRPVPASANRSLFRLFSDFAAPRFLILFLGVYVATILYFFPAQLLSVLSGYEFKIETNYDNSAFSFLMAGLFILGSILSNYFIINGKRYHIYAAAAIVFFILGALVTFSKGPFIFALLCGLCVFYRYARMPSFPVLAGLSVMAVLVLVYLIPAFSIYRATGTIELIDPRQLSLNMIYSDAAGPYGVMIYSLNGYLHTDGHPLWQSVLLWVPRFIWAARPIDLAEEFARQMIVNWQPGYGLGFSPLAEGYARFGVLGAPLIMAALGASVTLFERIASWFAPRDARLPIILTIGGYLSMTIMRNPLSAVFTQGIQLCVPIVLIAIAAKYLQDRQDARERMARDAARDPMPTYVA